MTVSASHLQVTVVAPVVTNAPWTGGPTTDPLSGDVIVTVGGAATVKLTVCEVVVPPDGVTNSVNVCPPGASEGLVCGLVHGLITGNESHWQPMLKVAPPPRVNAAVTGEGTVTPLTGEVMVGRIGGRYVKLTVRAVAPATFVAITVNECDPFANVGAACGLVQGLITGFASHWHVTVVASVVVKMP
jgi:hypothetical protein